jgi:hypothetical protein
VDLVKEVADLRAHLGAVSKILGPVWVPSVPAPPDEG